SHPGGMPYISRWREPPEPAPHHHPSRRAGGNGEQRWCWSRREVSGWRAGNRVHATLRGAAVFTRFRWLTPPANLWRDSGLRSTPFARKRIYSFAKWIRGTSPPLHRDDSIAAVEE